MMKEIIQHNEEVDFESLYKDIESRYVGIDFQDFNLFMQHKGEKHSFIGIDDGKDGIRKALGKVIENKDFQALLSHASALMITILRSSKSEKPLHIKEIDSINGFIATLPSECDTTWGIDFDDSLGNDIKVIILMAINK